MLPSKRPSLTFFSYLITESRNIKKVALPWAQCARLCIQNGGTNGIFLPYAGISEVGLLRTYTGRLGTFWQDLAACINGHSGRDFIVNELVVKTRLLSDVNKYPIEADLAVPAAALGAAMLAYFVHWQEIGESGSKPMMNTVCGYLDVLLLLVVPAAGEPEDDAVARI